MTKYKVDLIASYIIYADKVDDAKNEAVNELVDEIYEHGSVTTVKRLFSVNAEEIKEQNEKGDLEKVTEDEKQIESCLGI